ncbi:unnamed protein product [Protopolystoma xenopodis]|uniref:Uncharacterized protein n=1 Tax=Protopolystoma xenopodis TaxID=117903 RepID=A0A448XH32_9PLAT|nr:unnamed protein product [Protopolystoma xenopodis]
MSALVFPIRTKMGQSEDAKIIVDFDDSQVPDALVQFLLVLGICLVTASLVALCVHFCLLKHCECATHSETSPQASHRVSPTPDNVRAATLTPALRLPCKLNSDLAPLLHTGPGCPSTLTSGRMATTYIGTESSDWLFPYQRDADNSNQHEAEQPPSYERAVQQISPPQGLIAFLMPQK